MAFNVEAINSRLYLIGRLRVFSNSKVESYTKSLITQEKHTTRISFPLALLKALVHRTLRGFRFKLKFFLHLERQKRKTYIKSNS